jgi:hypothetical protein
MPPVERQSIYDATAAAIRQMKHQGLGLLSDCLLSSEARTRYESILGGTRGKEAIAKAGPLLIRQVADPQFVFSFASGMARDMEAVFWVELSECLIRDPICKYKDFGVFTRFARRVSFDSDQLADKIKLPTIYSAFEESAIDALLPDRTRMPAESSSLEESAIDALCRTVMEQIRQKMRSNEPSPRSFQMLSEELLRDTLNEIFGTFIPPTVNAMAALSFAAALASYYAWAVAFDVTIRSGRINVDGVGSFVFVQGQSGNRVDFTASENFLDLLEANARSSPFPEEQAA